MSSDSESYTSSIEIEANDANSQFIMIIAEHKVIFNKSQVPMIKERKEKSLELIRIKYTQIFGKQITRQQLRKKIQNMKNEVKKKTDKMATGNKKIRLKSWENSLLTLMNTEENPVFTKIPGKLCLHADCFSRYRVLGCHAIL